MLALACGASHEAAARQTGISVRTIARRLQDPEFRTRLKDLRSEMVTRASGMLTAASLDSVKTLLDLQKSGPPTVKLGAARSILEMACKLREIVDLQGQLEELEAEVTRLNEASSQHSLNGAYS